MKNAKVGFRVHALLLLSLTASVLSSCGGKEQFASTMLLSFNSPGDLGMRFSDILNHPELMRMPSLTVGVNSEILDGEMAVKSTSAKLFVGSKTFTGIQMESGAYYHFGVGSRCNSFLIGDNITFKYEIYDQAGSILQQKSVTVPHVDGC